MPMKWSVHAIVSAVVASPFLLMGSPANAEPVWLVTPEEVARLHAEFDAPLWVAKSAEGPVIEVMQPKLVGGRVDSPMVIDLVFRAAPDAAIEAGSFRVFYGALKLDVTQRLLKNVNVRADGLHVDKAEIPAGNHRLVLQISDTRQRTGTHDLRFVVQQ